MKMEIKKATPLVEWVAFYNISKGIFYSSKVALRRANKVVP